MLLVEHTELYLSATAVACITHGHGGRHLMCSIDELLGGGAFEGGLLELAGESSSGGPLRARPCCKIAALYSTSGLLCGWRNAASLSHGWLQDPLMLQKDSALSGQPYSFWLLLTYNSVTGHLANLFIPAPLSSNNGGTGNGPGTELPERAEHSILLRGSLEHTHTHTRQEAWRHAYGPSPPLPAAQAKHSCASWPQPARRAWASMWCISTPPTPSVHPGWPKSSASSR